MHHRTRNNRLAALLGVSTVIATLVTPAALVAQDANARQTLQITREIVKPGKGGAHAKHEVAWSRALEAAKYTGGALAMTSMSGANEVWFLSQYGTMADLQKMNEGYAASPALMAVSDKYAPAEADMLNNSLTMIASRRSDLSYTSGTPIQALRYMTVQRIAVKVGHNTEFVDARKIIKAAHEQTKMPDGFTVYQVNDGAPSGTYLVLRGLKSLAELDTNPHSANYVAAIGGADGQKKLNDMAMSYENSADVTLFQLNPAMSILPKEWSDADPFWKPKAALKKTP